MLLHKSSLATEKSVYDNFHATSSHLSVWERYERWEGGQRLGARVRRGKERAPLPLNA